MGAPGTRRGGLGESLEQVRRERRESWRSRRKLRDPREMLSPGLAPSEPTLGLGGHVAPVPCRGNK